MNKENNKIISGMGKYLSSYNLFCMFYGHKKVMKQPINLINISLIEKCLNSLNLKYVLSNFLYVNPSENCFEEEQNKIIYIGKDINDCIIAKEYDECFNGEFYVNHTINKKYSNVQATIGNGNLLGYPDCCVKKYIKTDSIDNDLFYILSSSVKNYLNCNNYLNSFENFVLHHIPCSFECQKSINQAKKILPYYIESFSKGLINEVIENIIIEKTYILFKSTNWIKLEKGKYYFGSILYNEDNLYKKIEKLVIKYKFQIKIINSLSVMLYNKNKNLLINNIQVFHFPQLDDKEEILNSLL